MYRAKLKSLAQRRRDADELRLGGATSEHVRSEELTLVRPDFEHDNALSRLGEQQPSSHPRDLH